MFLYKNYKNFPRDFSFIFIDDVDSFLKTAKNIDKVLYLMNFEEEDINLAMELIKEKTKQNKDLQKIEKLSQKVKKILQKKKGILVVSSATSNPKSNRIKLFRELLGFEVGTPTFYLRNIVDTYTEEQFDYENLVKWIKKLGKGGIIFVSSDKGKQEVENLKNILKNFGISSLTYEELDDKNIEAYKEGKVEVLIGISSYRNPLARGLDLPQIVRYAIFFGVPKIVISVNFEENLSHLLWTLTSIRSTIIKVYPDYSFKIEKWIENLKKYQYLTDEFLQNHPQMLEKIETLKKEISEFLSSSDIVDLLKNSEDITLRQSEEGYFLVVSDVTGYLQASGRTSRMFAGGISKGLSLILVDDKRALKHLQKRVRWFNDEIEFVSVESINIEEVLKDIDNDREKIKKIITGKEKPQTKELLRPVLIVVESPNKARTIANFFGKPIRRKIGKHELLGTSVEDRYLMITASLGHILDLNKENGYFGVDINDNIVPIYEAIEGKENIISSLRLMATESEEILIATDPDTKGEKIGWDIRLLINPIINNIKRMEFHEVTKKAILKSIKEPRDFNENLVKAQIVRRVADRWVGFEFSQILWKVFGKNWLSAGRVQTPVLGWIIEREKESKIKIYKVIINLDENDKKFHLEFTFEKQDEANEFFNNLKYVDVEKLEEKEELINPLPPYRTDTLLKDANDKFRLSLPKTMGLAQDLFEFGFITYHRTDSIRVSDFGISLAKEYIEKEIGPDYFYPRIWGEGGAHECIRPTKILEPEELKSLMLGGQIEGLTREHILLYSLIFKRFIASQMKPAKVKVLKVVIKVLDKVKEEELKTEILENGFNLLTPIILNPYLKGVINIENKKALKIVPKSYLYTQGELVKDMKEI